MEVDEQYSQGLCFTQFSTRVYWNRSFAASDPFPMFAQSIKFYTFYCHIVDHVLDSTDVWKMWYISMDSSNIQKWIVASFSISESFTATFDLVFALSQESAFS